MMTLHTLLAGLVFFPPCLIMATQLGRMFPQEGTLYHWTQRAMGSYWGFFAGFCTWFPGILISSNIANLFVNYTQMLLHFSFTTPLQKGLAISIVLLVASVIGTRRCFIHRYLLWGGVLILVMYLINTFATLSVGTTQTAYDPLALVTIVTNTLGKPFGTIITLCLMGSSFAAILAYNSILVRLLFVASVDYRLPAALHTLSKRQVPANALLFQGFLAITATLLIFVITPCIATSGTLNDFSVEGYSVTQAAASLIWIISMLFLFIDFVCCYLRDPGGFRHICILPIPLLFFFTLLGIASGTLTITTTLLFSWTPLIPNTDWIYLIGSLTMTFIIIATLGSMIAHSEAIWREIHTVLLDTEKHKILPKKWKP